VFISADGHAAHLPHGLAGRLCAGEEAFWGKGFIFTLFVCAMALPKQVILIPLVTLAKNLGCPNPCGR
jgi:multiple sugar transport system permease protein